MKTQHTPGPWKVHPDPVHAGKHPFHNVRFVTTDDAQFEEGFDHLESGSIICTLRDSVEIEGNARLIAAAPELLGMLREFARLADIGRLPAFDTLRAGRTAIARATGGDQ